MKKENRNSRKRKIPESEAEASMNKKGKIITNDLVLVKNEKKNNSSSIIDLPTDSDSEVKDKSKDPNIKFSLPEKKTNLKDLNIELLGYMSCFYTIREMFEFIKINKRIRTSIVLKSKAFSIFITMRRTEKLVYIPGMRIFTNYFYNNVLNIILESLPSKDTSKDTSEGISENERKHLLECFLSNLNKETHFYFQNPCSKEIFYLSLILSAERCLVNCLDVTLNYWSFPQVPQVPPNFTEEDINEIAKELKSSLTKNKSLKTLKLNIFTAEKFMGIFEAIANNKKIIDLNCQIEFSDNNSFTDNMPTVYRNFNQNKSIKFLSLTYNLRVEESEENSLNNFIATNTNLKQLNLDFIRLPRNYFPFNGLKRNNSIEVLSISGTPIKRKALKALSEALYQPANPKPNTNMNTSIHALILSNIHIDHPNCCKYIGDIINNNKSIINLILSNNRINSTRALPLFEALKTNTSIRTLIMNSNKLEKDGFEALISMLKENRTLREVDVSRNFINGESDSVIEMLNENKEIRSLKLDYNHINKETKEKVKEILASR